MSKNLISGKEFKEMPILSSYAPFYESYLDSIYRVMYQSLEAHPRTTAFRFELHLPIDLYVNIDRLTERFVASLKSKLKHARVQSNNPSAHGTDVRYVWALEYSQTERMHYHFILFLNRDAYRSFGLFEEGRKNIYNRIVEAWASALGIKLFKNAQGLVYIPDNPVYALSKNLQENIDSFFYRASYLAKVDTKMNGSRHSFGSSKR